VLYWRPRVLALQMNLQAHKAKSPQGLYPAVRTVGPTPSRLVPPIEIGAGGPAAAGGRPPPTDLVSSETLLTR